MAVSVQLPGRFKINLNIRVNQWRGGFPHGLTNNLHEIGMALVNSVLEEIVHLLRGFGCLDVGVRLVGSLDARVSEC